MISPFLELDKERRERDAMLMNKLSQFGGSMVQAPLTFQNLFQEQEDRQRKIASDAEELGRKRAEEGREVERAKRDADKFTQDTEGHKQKMEKGTFELGKEKEEFTESKISKNVSDLVSGMIQQGASDQEIIERSFGHPEMEEVTDQSVIEGEIGRQRQKLAEGESKLGLKGRELDIKQQMADARKKDAETRATRSVAKAKAVRPPRPRLLGEAATKRLEDLEIRLDDFARMRSFMDADSMGLAPGLIEMVKRRVKLDTPKEALFSTEVNKSMNEELHRLGGATLTDNEFARISRALPSTYDSADVFEALVEASEAKLLNDYNKIIKTQGMAGRDVSGFVPKKTEGQTNQEENSKLDEIIKALGGAK